MTRSRWKKLWRAFCEGLWSITLYPILEPPPRRKLKRLRLPDDPFEVDRKALRGDQERVHKDFERASARLRVLPKAEDDHEP